MFLLHLSICIRTILRFVYEHFIFSTVSCIYARVGIYCTSTHNFLLKYYVLMCGLEEFINLMFDFFLVSKLSALCAVLFCKFLRCDVHVTRR